MPSWHLKFACSSGATRAPSRRRRLHGARCRVQHERDANAVAGRDARRLQFRLADAQVRLAAVDGEGRAPHVAPDGDADRRTRFSEHGAPAERSAAASWAPGRGASRGEGTSTGTAPTRRLPASVSAWSRLRGMCCRGTPIEQSTRLPVSRWRNDRASFGRNLTPPRTRRHRCHAPHGRRVCVANVRGGQGRSSLQGVARPSDRP